MRNEAGRIALIATLFALTACAPRYLIYSDSKFPGLALKGVLAKIQIEDAREDQRKIHVSFLNPDSASAFNIPLDSLDSLAILGQLRRNWLDRGKWISVKVRVVEAQAGYQVFFWHADEFCKAKINIQAYSGGAKVAECSGSAELQRRSPWASEKSMKRIFAEALDLSVYKCLEAVRPELSGPGIESADPGEI